MLIRWSCSSRVPKQNNILAKARRKRTFMLVKLLVRKRNVKSSALPYAYPCPSKNLV